MTETLQLYWHYVLISVRGQMQYRASFIMATVGNFAVAVIDFLAIWALFDRFGSLRGWTLAEGAVFYGMINMAFAFAEGVGRGFDAFPAMVKSGDFDRILLRPRGSAFQIAASQVHMVRIGRLLQAIAVLLWGASMMDVTWTLARVGLVLFAVFGGACLFTGLFVVQATIAFWTTESLELLNTLTDGGREAGSYPMAIYRPWFRRFFTFLVPLACVSYYPALAIMDRADEVGATSSVFHYLAPAVGVVFLLAALQFWQVGVRRYGSTGS